MASQFPVPVAVPQFPVPVVMPPLLLWAVPLEHEAKTNSFFPRLVLVMAFYHNIRKITNPNETLIELSSTWLVPASVAICDEPVTEILVGK